MRYLTIVALTASAGFLLVWAWVLTMPMAYMDPEYPVWRAKLALLDHCRLPETLVLGDSRAAAGILPDHLPIPVANLAVGGGQPIEALVMARRTLACSHPPRRVILSLAPSHFRGADLFWERSVRYGLMSSADLDELRANSRQTNDFSVYAERHVAGFPDQMRDWLYRIRFPAFEFGSLLHSAAITRWHSNQSLFQAAIKSNGQYYFGTRDGSSDVAAEGRLADFRPSPILDLYFNALLTRLDAAGIDIWFVTMPINQATWDVMNPATRDHFAAYLRSYERRYPHFHVASDLALHWPDHDFGDEFCHLNPNGAERFSTVLAEMLQDHPSDDSSNPTAVTRSIDLSRGS